MGDDSFLSAIAVAPDDRQLRLVYADWLEQQGDPRCELLRVAAQMRTRPSLDAQYWQLHDRRAALLTKANSDWVTQVGGLDVERPFFAKLPESRADRWRLVEKFIAQWHGPLGPDDGASEEEIAATEQRLGVPLPAALREWHQLAGRRTDIWSGFGQMYSLRDIERDDASDALYFHESILEDTFAVAVSDIAHDDPQVRCRHVPLEFGTTTSFAIQRLLLSTVSGCSTTQYLSFRSQDWPLMSWGEEFRDGCWSCDIPPGDTLLVGVHISEAPGVLINWSRGVFALALSEDAWRSIPAGIRERFERLETTANPDP